MQNTPTHLILPTIALMLGMIVFHSCSQSNAILKKGPNYFGLQIIPDESIEVSDELDSLVSKGDMEVKLSGTIREICQSKGCWMTLAGENGESSVFIQFKDYAFFMPKDASGLRSIVQGRLYEHMTSVEEQQHFAEDKGATKEEIAAITQPKRELRMEAEGVIIYN